MALNEELISINASHAIYVNRLASGLGNKAEPFVDNVSKLINERLQKEVGRNLTPPRRERLLTDIHAITSSELKQYTSELKTEHKEFGGYEAAFQAKSVNSLLTTVETVSVSATVVDRTAKNSLIKLGEGSYTTYNQMLSKYWKDNADQVSAIVANGFQSGITTRELANNIMAEVDGRLNKTKKQALGIARTGTTHYANQARKAYFEENEVIVGTRRIAVIDSATSQYCRGVDQTVVLKTDPNYRNAFAPFHPNCVLGGTFITSANSISSVSKRRFEGLMVTIKSASGNEVTVTPNHPILTVSGWVPAYLLNNFDKLILQSSAKGVCGVDWNNDTTHTTAKDIFLSVGCSGKMASSEVPLSAPDFHGDAIDDEIAEILSDIDLLTVGDPILIKKLSESGFRGANEVASTRKCLGSLLKLFVSGNSTSQGIMRRAGKCLSVLGRSIVHPSLLLLGRVSDMNAIIDKDSLYWTFRDAEHLSNATNSDTSVISIDNVVSVTYAKNCSFHVYNLQTVDHCYSANGIITHNCRTANVPEIDGRYAQDDDEGDRASNFRVDGLLDPKPVNSKNIYYDELKELDANSQDAVLGVALGKAFRKGLKDGSLTPSEFAKLTVNENLNKAYTVTELKAQDNILSDILNKQARK